MNSDLIQQGKVISVEAFAGIEPAKILGRFPDFFSGVMSSAGAALSSLHHAAATAFTDTGEFRRFLTKNSYAKLMEREVFAPNGFTGTYLEYLAKLKPELDIALKVPSEVLKPFQRYVSALSSEPNKLASINPASIPKIGSGIEIHKETANLEHLSQEKNPGNPGAKITYKEAVARNNDWATVLKEIEDIDKRIEATNPKEFLEEVGVTGDILNKLIERIKEQPDTYHTSATQLDALASLVMEVARAVEFYAAVIYLYNRFRHAVHESRSTLLQAA
jgi:hypothetical protein